MKIRSYTGSALEPMYEAIRRELGPNAVVIPVKQPSKKRSMLSLGKQEYQLIAVAEDTDADEHLVSTVGQEGLKDFSIEQDEHWMRMEKNMEQLRNELHNMSAVGGGSGGNRGGLPGFAADWDERFLEKCGLDGIDLDDPMGVEQLRGRVEDALPVKSDVAPREGRGRPEIFVFVGPTGSGKTTTLAKLAARWCLEDNRKVALITTDTFRISAVDQIKEYGTLLGIEVAVAFSAAEAVRAAGQFSDKDVILVDTPGRNHYDQVGLAGIKGVLSGLGDVTTMLHVPAGLDPRQASEIADNFQQLNPDCLVLTKIDEVRRYGVLTALACDMDCPLGFITNGQRVPQDIRSADARELAELMVPEDAAGCAGSRDRKAAVSV